MITIKLRLSIPFNKSKERQIPFYSEHQSILGHVVRLTSIAERKCSNCSVVSL